MDANTSVSDIGEPRPIAGRDLVLATTEPNQVQAPALPAWDTDAAVAFLIALIEAGLLAVAAIDPVSGGCHGKTFALPAERDALSRWIEARQGKANLYFTLNEPVPPERQQGENGRLCKADIARIRGVAIDCDPRFDPEAEDGGLVEERKRLREQALGWRQRAGASAVIDSGGGYQAIWLLQDPLNTTLEEQVSARTSELMRVEEALRQSQKMEAVGQLTGGLAHDFNNLLAGISGSLELMQTRMQQGRLTDVDRYMTAAQGAAKRAAALTHRLLAFSRRQTLDPKPTNVTRLAMGLQELIQRTVGPGIPVEVVGASSSWPALVDPSQLENALLNLCINARDAMPDGGRITIETANKWLDERAAHQLDMLEGQYLSLSVTDTGTGMPPEVVARVFEPFFTTKPIGEGTGLGLSMIYGFAQQSGGQVRIYSEVGQGTTVCIYLPRHYGEVSDEDASVTVADLPRSEQGETVLIVDDEPTVRMLVTDILEDLGYTAIEAGDSVAGLKVLQSDVRIDLLITDVGLPGGMNGRQMADAARVYRSDLKVLFITGYAENAILGNGSLAPGMAVLTKPFAMDNMAARIRSMIEDSKEQARRS